MLRSNIIINKNFGNKWHVILKVFMFNYVIKYEKQMDFETNNIVGCIGALLLFSSLFTFTITFGLILFIGIILVIISLYGLAKNYKDKEVFNNVIYGTSSVIIGAVITLTLVAASPIWITLKNNVHQYVPNWNGNYVNLVKGVATNWFHIFTDTISHGGAWIIMMIVIFWVFLIIAMFFIQKSLKKLAKHSHNNTFTTTGTLLIMGAIPIIGLIGIWLSTALLANAFFTTKKPNPTPPQIMLTATPETNLLYCPHCNTLLLSENKYCHHCGQKIEE